ncbi:MAG: 2,3-bisphosphoglycerate-independent phosphoglycerate mutase [Candidatus Omnitrophota bacterium]
MLKKRPVCLIIRDGWGKGNPNDSNAIFNANTPFADKIEAEYPTTFIETSGESVGLPEGTQGNSEVGHLNIGAGRVVYQSLTRIDKEIRTGEFFKNKVLLESLGIAKANHSRVHLIGLIQDEGIHATTRHCIALLDMCKRNGVSEVLIHAITDGRDTPPQSAPEHMAFLQQGMDRFGIGRIATVAGRYYVMDRDKRWNRTETAYRAIMEGIGQPSANWQNAIHEAYAAGETDEFIKPRIIGDYHGISPDHPDDVIIYFNFRFDRTRQLTKAIVEPDFNEFKTVPHHVHFTAMTHYYDNGHFSEVFPQISYDNILGEVLAKNGLKQLRCAETEKYAHVTFFFNAQVNEPFEGEDRILIDSPKDVSTYDQKPEMSAFQVRDALVNAIRSQKYDCIITNFANCDMVGHTGKFDKIVQAVEVVDRCVKDVTEAVLAEGGACIITADHGNADQTKLEDGSVMTSHTLNPVPLSIVGIGSASEVKLSDNGKLSDIAPTILQLMAIPQPAEMDGTSLII